MGAARVDDKNAIGSAVDPDAVFLLPLGVDAERVVGWIADFEDGGGLEEGARQEEAKEGDKPGAQKTGDCTPYQAATTIVDLIVLRTTGCHPVAGRSFRGTPRRRPHLLA